MGGDARELVPDLPCLAGMPLRADAGAATPMTPAGPVHRRVLRGTMSNVAGQAVIVITAIALVPIVLHDVGATDYGTWILITSIASLATLLDAGMSAALVKFVAEHVARSEHAEAGRLVAAATWLYAIIGLAIAATGMVLALVLPVLFSLDGHTREIVPALVALTSLAAGISVPQVAPMSILRGVQRYDAVNVVYAASALSGAGLTIAALQAGAGIVGVAGATVVSTAATYAAASVLARRVALEVRASPIRCDRPRLRRLISFSASVSAIQVAGSLQTRMDAIIIGSLLPVRLVTPYSFAQRLAESTRLVTGQFTTVLLPVATELGATRDEESIRRFFLTASRMTVVIALGVALPLALFGDSVLELWVGDAYRGYGGLVAILAASTVIDVASYPAAAVLQGLERHQALAWMALASGLANVGLSLAFVRPFGVTGVAAATLIVTGVEIVFLVVPHAARVLGVSPLEWAREVLGRLVLPVAVCCGLLLGGAEVVSISSLPGLVVVVVTGLAGYLGVYLLVAASADERRAYRSLVWQRPRP